MSFAPAPTTPAAEITPSAHEHAMTSHAIDESTADTAGILAEGFLPEAAGDELVDQAEAFLRQRRPNPRSRPMPAFEHHAEAHLQIEGPHSELSIPEADDGRHEIGQVIAATPLDDMGLEFDEPTVEEMFAPIAVHPAESTGPAIGELETGLGEGLIFDDEPAPVSGDLPDTLSAPEIHAEEELPELHEAPAGEHGLSATAAENLVPAPEVQAGDAAVPSDETVEATGDMARPADWVPPPHSSLPPGNLQIEEVEAEAPAPAQQAAPPTPSAPRQSSMSMLLGMSRDFGSFLGGTPLSLGSAGAPRPTIFHGTAPKPPPFPAAMPKAPPAAPKPPPLPAARAKPASPFGDTPVASLFKDGVPQFRQVVTPNPGSIPAAQAPEATPPPSAPAAGLAASVATVAHDVWAVVPHPAARQQETFAPAPPAIAATFAPAAPPIVVPPPHAAAAPIQQTEDELEELPEVAGLPDAGPEAELEAASRS